MCKGNAWLYLGSFKGRCLISNFKNKSYFKDNSKKGNQDKKTTEKYKSLRPVEAAHEQSLD